MNKFGSLLCVLLCAFLYNAPELQAQGRIDKATPKGTIGLGLVGAELGLSIPALAGLHETWSLITFPLVGAAGGSLAGYFLVDKPDRKVTSVALLSVGLTLLVPAIILTVHGMRFDPDEEDDADADAVSSTHSSTTAGLLRFDEEKIGLGVPLFWVENSLSLNDVQKFRGQGRDEFHLALMSGTF